MHKHYKLTSKGNGWAIMVRKSAGTVTDSNWVSLGGCPSHMVAMRVYLVLKTRGGS